MNVTLHRSLPVFSGFSRLNKEAPASEGESETRSPTLGDQVFTNVPGEFRQIINQSTPTTLATSTLIYFPALLCADQPLHGEPLPNLSDRREDNEEDEEDAAEPSEQETAGLAIKPALESTTDVGDTEGMHIASGVNLD